MKNCFLLGDRIYLRALQEKDVDGNYIQWLNDEEVCKFNSHHIFPYVRAAAEEYIKMSWNNLNSIILAIVLKSNDEHIGNISLQNINFINRSAEFAILLGEKKFWGQGFSKEAGFLLFKHAFFVVNLERIYCGTSSENIAMQKLASYLGMVEEGLRRRALYKDGRFMDICEYGILKEEFLARLKQLEAKVDYGYKKNGEAVI